MSSRKLLGILAALGLVAFLAWSTLSSQRAECGACVTFKGRRNCATASAASPSEAAESAQATACGTIAAGMTEGRVCASIRPDSLRCRTL